MKQTLFYKMLSGPNGSVSSKRGAMFACLFVFLGGYIASFFKLQPLAVIQDQLFTALLATFATVFGDNIVKANENINMKKSDQPATNVNTVINKNEGADVTQVVLPENK